MAFAKDLTFNGSYRYSDYSTDVNTSTYGMGLDWSIIDDVKLRGSFQHAVRAPNVIELFTPAGLGLFDMSRDPCGTKGVLPPSASLAACVASGLDPVLYGTDLDSPAGQYNAIFGGNENLQPEKADTWTVGIVFTPTFLEGFSATVDYWNIKVDDTIASVPPDVTLDQCIATLSPVYCSQVTRDSDGTLWLHPEAQIIATNINIGSLETSGIDVNANYVFSMTDWGSLNFAFIGTYLDNFISEPLPGAVKYDCAGLYGTTCGTPAPTWRSKFRTTWNTPWNVDLSLNWRYFGSVKVDGTSVIRT